MKKVLYMRVTRDKYELPIAVEESPTMLTLKLGLKANTVKSLISRRYNGFCKVEVDDEED